MSLSAVWGCVLAAPFAILNSMLHIPIMFLEDGVPDSIMVLSEQYNEWEVFLYALYKNKVSWLE